MKTAAFGKYKGQPLRDVPLPYLLFIMTRLGIRREHPEVVADFLDEIANRLVGDFDGALAELLAPVPADVLAAAKLEKVRKARANLAKLQAQRQAEHQVKLAALRARSAAP